MFYRYVQYWLGDQSLLLQEGEAWKSSRHLITPAFHFTILQEYAVRLAPSPIPCCDALPTLHLRTHNAPLYLSVLHPHIHNAHSLPQFGCS